MRKFTENEWSKNSWEEIAFNTYKNVNVKFLIDREYAHAGIVVNKLYWGKIAIS